MNIGIPTEIKSGEARVGLTPLEVRALVDSGQRVFVQSNAGVGVQISDDRFANAGAQIVADAKTLWAQSELIAKVKEIQTPEYDFLRQDHIVCGFAQLARDRTLLNVVCEKGATILAYECVRDANGATPILAPMSRIAGAMCPSIAAWCLHHAQGGAGILLDAHARILVVGLGVSALAAAEGFARAGAHVTLAFRNEGKAKALAKRLPKTISFVPMAQIPALLPNSNVLIGAAAEHGKLSPKLITRALLRTMKRGSVFIDIGIDMGGISETSKQTKWSDPTFIDEDVVHFCVSNMPAQVPASAASQLAAAALPTLLEIANRGVDVAMKSNAGLARGVQVLRGAIVDAALKVK